jgi:hypothetical protein
MLSGAKNLGASKINMLRDSSSPTAPQNDIFGDFFSSLLEREKYFKTGFGRHFLKNHLESYREEMQ